MIVLFAPLTAALFAGWLMFVVELVLNSATARTRDAVEATVVGAMGPEADSKGRPRASFTPIVRFVASGHEVTAQVPSVWGLRRHWLQRAVRLHVRSDQTKARIVEPRHRVLDLIQVLVGGVIVFAVAYAVWEGARLLLGHGG